MRSTRILIGAAAVLLTLGCQNENTTTSLAAGTPAADRSSRQDGDHGVADGEATLDFRGMVGNVLTGQTGSLRDLQAGGLPWVVRRARARLTEDGRLRVDVEGLVLAAGPLAGTNPIPQFRAVLSCRTENAAGTGYDTVNVASAPVTASSDGNARIDVRLDGVPERCLAPAIFVTSPGLQWFAVAG